jgi:DNA repair photolyase
MITKYEHNTSSLDERFDAFNKLQKKAKGYLLRAAIEPIIAYPGFEDDYKLLAQRMVKELDLGASNVEKIKFGCLRIGPQLWPRIESNHAGTKLFSDNQMLYPVVAPDTKFRYSEDVRLKIYGILLSEFGQFRPKLGLACEYPSIWKKLDLSYEDHMKSYIYQFPG